MELLTLLAAPILTALIAPVILEMIKKRIDKKKQERELQDKGVDRNLILADQLRDELREENVDLKKFVDELQQRIVDHAGAQGEIDKWQAKFYNLRKENRRLAFDLALMKKELEFLREKYEEYIAVRERAEQQFGRDSDDPA